MNDVEIKDIDRLKALLTEFGVEFRETNYTRLSAISLFDDYHGVEFYFTSSGNFTTWEVD